MTNDNPNRKHSVSQTKQILEYMRAGNTITPSEARELFHSDRLGARISDIEKIVGYKPPRRMIAVKGLDSEGNPVMKHVMQYWLEPEN